MSKKLIVQLLLNTTVLMAIAGFFPNYISFTHWTYGLLAGILLGLINYYLKPFITMIALPINLMTFGLTALIINGLLLEFISYLIQPYFKISSFGVAILTAVVINVINNYYNGNIKVKFIRMNHKDDNK